jgi:hypothetical protein
MEEPVHDRSTGPADRPGERLRTSGPQAFLLVEVADRVGDGGMEHGAIVPRTAENG